MANINNIKTGWVQFKEGYLSAGNLINLAVNQIIYIFTAGYFWFTSILRGKPGLMQVRTRVKKGGREKKVLISFVLRPLFKSYFIGRIRYYFSINGLTIYLIRAFNELGYTCHVLHAIDTSFKVKDNYDVVVFGDVANYESISHQLPKSCVQIAFQTGAYWKIHNQKEEERFMELKQRTGADLKRDRWATNGEKVDTMLKKVSAILALGDYFTRETFQALPHVHPFKSAFLEDSNFTEKNIIGKNFEKAKNNFLYFGGGGEVHKGQDLLLEVFSKLPQFNLYLCSNFSPAFLKVYEAVLKESPNIHIIGYLPQRSKGFYELIDKCCFNVHPSCSEGSPGGVIELLQYGIVPAVSYESNINVSSFGFQLKNHSIEEITKTVLELSNLPSEEIKKLSLKTRQLGFEQFSTPVFLRDLKYILQEKIKIP